MNLGVAEVEPGLFEGMASLFQTGACQLHGRRFLHKLVQIAVEITAGSALHEIVVDRVGVVLDRRDL